MNKGLSGFAVEKKDNKIIKWTKGKDSIYRLRKDCMKHIKAQDQFKISKVVPVYSFMELDDYFEMELPYLELPSGFDVDYSTIKDKILNCLKSRFEGNKTGFKRICLNQLNESINLLSKQKFKDQGLFLAQKIGRLIDESDDYYPSGPNHGDFGLANMLIDDNINLIDVTHSFLYSPLVDVATHSMCGMFSRKDKDTKLILQEFKGYYPQIRVIRLLKMFSWLPYAQIDNWRAELIKRIEDE